MGPTSELSGTANPRDRLLYRVVNGNVPQEANLGVTQFYMNYYDALGDTIYHPIINMGEISSIEINVTVENVAANSFIFPGSNNLPEILVYIYNIYFDI